MDRDDIDNATSISQPLIFSSEQPMQVACRLRLPSHGDFSAWFSHLVPQLYEQCFALEWFYARRPLRTSLTRDLYKPTSIRLKRL